MLTLGEELILLAYDDEKGTIGWQWDSGMAYALAGSVLAELALRDRVGSDGKHMVVLDATATGDDILDHGLALIAAAKRPRDAKHWVSTFHGKIKRLEQRLRGRLVDQGILREEEHKVLLVFPDRRYPEANPAPEDELRGRIRDVVLNDATPDERTAVLISLAKLDRSIDNVFSKDERRRARTRISQLAKQEPFGAAAGAAKAASEATEAAVIAAIAVGASAGSSN